MIQLSIDIIILFINYFWETYMQALIITTLFRIPCTQKQNLIYTLILSIYGVFAKLYIPIELSYLNTILSIFIIPIVLKLVYSKKIHECLLYTFIIFLISIPTEAIAGLIAFKIFNLETNVTDVVKTIPILLMIKVWFTSVALVIFLLTVKSKTAIFSSQDIVNKTFPHIDMIIVVITILPNLLFYTVNKYQYPLYILIFNIVMNIMLVAVCIYNTYKSVQLEKKKQELELSEQHNKTLNNLLDSVRTFKHDYSNVIHSIGGYITFGDMDGLAKYYSGLSRETKKLGQLEAISPAKITVPAIYTLFAAKHENAYSKDILFNVETMFDYKNISMPIFDFCKILGILLDNAIEAAEESDEREINVILRRSVADRVQIFSIENTYKDKDIDTEKIFEKGFSTKNRNSGIGLWEVKNIVDKNKNVELVTSKDKKFFTQKLIILEEEIKEK